MPKKNTSYFIENMDVSKVTDFSKFRGGWRFVAEIREFGMVVGSCRWGNQMPEQIINI